MELQGVLGWLFAVGGALLWLWEASKVVQRQRSENEKMKEFLREATEAMKHLYRSQENALRFYREIVLMFKGDNMAKKASAKYTVQVAGKSYSATDPLEAIKKAKESGVEADGNLVLKGLFTAPRRLPHKKA